MNNLLKRWALLVALLALSSSPVLAQTYVSKWSAEGNANDVYGNNNGTEVGNVWYEAEGKVGQAFRFDGSPGRIEIPDDTSLDFTGGMTVSAWFKLKPGTNSGYILNKEDGRLVNNPRKGWSVHVNGVNNGCADRIKCIGSVAFNVFSTNNTYANLNTSAFNAPNYMDDEWHHFVGVYDATTGRVRVYMDGGFIGSSAVSVPDVGLNDLPIVIGGHPNGSSPTGLIDEVAVYNESLNETVIEELANETPAPTLGPVPAGMDVLLEDEFDGTSLNSGIWDSSIPNGGSITVADGVATFESGSSVGFPSIENSEPAFPCAGDFVFETALKYDEITALGNGVQVRNGSTSIFGIWADNGGYGLRVNLFGLSEIHTIASASAPEAKAYHTYKLERIDGNYSVYVDDSLVIGPVANALTPDNVLIGHHPTTAGGAWTDFNIAYARVSASPPPPPVSLVFEDFSDLSAFKLNGSASGAVSGGDDVLRLTPAANGQAGSAFLKEPISLACDAAFSAAFSFQITNSGGVSDTDGIGADGLVFIVTQTPNAVGGAGVGIGYAGIPNSIGVEFDTWDNSNHNGNPDIYGDDNGNHVAVNLNGNIRYPIGYRNVSPRMNNGQLWYAWVDYDGTTTTLEMRLSLSPQRPETPTISVVRDLAQSLGESVYVGFSSGTGGAYGNHDIVGLQFNNEYDPIIDVPGPSNSAPIADAGTSAPLEAVSPSGTEVTLDGSGSSDPDNDVLTYMWLADGITFVDATSATPTGSFPVGETTVTLTVDDGNGETSTDEVVVTITDGTAPTLTIPGGITAECTGPNGESIELGTASATDNGDANPVITNDAPDTFSMGTTVVTWTATDASGNATSAEQTVIVQDTTSPELTVPGDITAEATSPDGASVDLGEASASDICDPDPAITNDGALSVYPLGSTTVTWTATDASGNATSGDQLVNVVDTTPPDVNFSLNTGTLWPPNHKMVQVASGISASDIADENPSVVITVTSDEDINGTGDGNTDVDWEVNNGTVYLRAERDGGQDGRVYTVTVVATDAAGNTTTVTGTVEVPHGQEVASADAGNGKGKGKAKKLVVVSQSVTPVLVVGEAKVIAGQSSGVALSQGESVTVVGAGPVVADQLLDISGEADVASRMQEIVVENHTFSLSQNHPNPFNPETVIGYALGEASDVRLIIYNVLGQQVRELVNASQAPGQYQVRWDGRNALGAQVTSGVYIYRLVAGTQVEMRKMILLK